MTKRKWGRLGASVVCHLLFVSLSAHATLPQSGLQLAEENWKNLPPVTDKSVERLCDEAHLLLWQAKYSPDKEKASMLLEEAWVRAESARQQAPRNPRALLYWEAVKGELAQVKNKIVALSYIKPLEEGALELKELAPTFRHCAADRILGNLYSKAPGLISIGDKQKAAAHFQSMLKLCPAHPENEIYYAEFLLGEDKLQEAKEYATRALASPVLKDFPIERVAWEAMAREIIAKAERAG